MVRNVNIRKIKIVPYQVQKENKVKMQSHTNAKRIFWPFAVFWMAITVTMLLSLFY